MTGPYLKSLYMLGWRSGATSEVPPTNEAAAVFIIGYRDGEAAVLAAAAFADAEFDEAPDGDT